MAGGIDTSRLGQRLARLGPPPPSPSPNLGVAHEGALHCIDRTWPQAHAHGASPIALALTGCDELATVALDSRFSELDRSRMLFIDTETTGLSGGTGTLAFLVGLAWFDQGSMCTRQMLLRRPNEERAMLGLLAERLAWASCVVTYNGKSFDWPLLCNRFVMNRLKIPLAPAHLDLLHVARRIVRRRMSSVRLVEIERELLGFHRVDDIEGALIPQRYFDFLISRDFTLLDPVVEHNAYDLLALAALLGWIGQLLREGAGDARDHLCVGEVALRFGKIEVARRFALRSAQASEGLVRAEALAFLGKLAKQQGAFDESAGFFTEALACAGDPLFVAALHLALAKLCEHQFGHHDRALFHARHAVAIEGAALNESRVTRLERRLATARR